MSAIWTACSGACEIRPLRGVMWRVVAAQQQVASAKLTRSFTDQNVLEDILDQAQAGPALEHFGRHRLIAAPFRQPPLKRGSRFGRSTEQGLFYGSRELVTALTETAYYRLLFAAGSRARILPITTHHRAFKVRYRTRFGVDLSAPPFDTYAEPLTAADDYNATQSLGTTMREQGVQLFRFLSARHLGGTNVAAFTANAITSVQPIETSLWTFLTKHHAVRVLEQTANGGRRYRFPRAGFLVNGELPQAAI